MNVTGTFVASPTADAPITVELTNASHDHILKTNVLRTFVKLSASED